LKASSDNFLGFRGFFVFFESEDPSLMPDESLSKVDKLDMNAFLEITNWGEGSSRASLTLTFPATKTLPISLDVGENSNRLREH
jgi:hypothetical protein